MTVRHWGRINGHERNRENRRQQHRKNRSAHVATIGALGVSRGGLVVLEWGDDDWVGKCILVWNKARGWGCLSWTIMKQAARLCWKMAMYM